MIRLPRTVVVTEASAGMGRATALALATRGDRAAVARGSAGLTGAADEVRHAGGEGLILAVDVADPKAIVRAAQQVVDAFGRIDVWVNNAFAGVVAPFTQATPDACRRATEVTGLCCVFGMREALSPIDLNNRGPIAQVGSALAYRGVPLQSAYCGAKQAIEGLNESLRCDLLHEGTPARTTVMQVPAVNPPKFDGVLSHAPGLGARATDHAAAQPRSLESWIGGSTVAQLVPGLLDRFLAHGHDAQLHKGERAGAGNLCSPADEPGDGTSGHSGASVRRPGGVVHREWRSRNRAWAGKAAFIVCGAALFARKVSHSAGDFSSAVPRRLAAPGRGTRKARMSDHIGGETWRDLAS
jgi:NAD(P)-dependent dehydrogenase (short-subunit alcohol dehydrogenase family)